MSEIYIYLDVVSKLDYGMIGGPHALRGGAKPFLYMRIRMESKGVFFYF
jgi:hypothetical protein